MLSGLNKYIYNQNWNIGFANITPSELIRSKSLGCVHWMKHPYKDRFFADPFILKSDSEYIYILVEEMEFDKWGIISLLKIDRLDYNLVDRKVILQKQTHLSYPNILRLNDTVFIYPENSAAGKLKLYQLDDETFSLTEIDVMAELPLTDATIFPIEIKGNHYMISTQAPDSQRNAIILKSENLYGLFRPTDKVISIATPDRARCGGNFFESDGSYFRPAQNCEKRYGGSLKIMKVDEIGASGYKEHMIFEIKPNSWKYNLGLHTLNFNESNNLAVIDGYGYLYPLFGRFYNILHNIKNLL